jgi:hypothetical protein
MTPMDNIVIKSFDWNVDQFLRLIQNFQEKCWKDGLEKGKTYSNEEINFLKRLYPESDLVLGAYYEDNLLAVLGASPSKVKFRDAILNAAGIGSWGLDPAVLSELTGGESDKETKIFEKAQLEIFQQMLNEITERVKNGNVDFLYATPIPFESKVLAEFLQTTWGLLNKNVENMLKIMGREAIDFIKDKIGLNILEAQAVKLVAGMKSDRIESGELRESNEEDIPKIVEILNTYSKIHEVARIWTSEEFQSYLGKFEGLKEKDYKSKGEFPEAPFGSGIIVWEDAGDIKAAVVYEINEMYFKTGYLPVLWIHQIGFTDEMINQDPKEVKKAKNALIGSFLAPYHLKTYICYAPLPYYDEKLFDGFIGERRNTPLLIKILTDKANGLAELKKLKQFYLPAIDFKIH